TIFTNGKIVTVDDAFSVTDAMAVDGERIVALGEKAKALAAEQADAKRVDLGGRMVLPGLMDSHAHPVAAATMEFDHSVPDIEDIPQLLDYIASRAKALPDGSLIGISQIFITRLREQRYPTREELDRVAPKNPVVFSTGPDASLNTLALKLSKIGKDFKVTDGGPGFIEKDLKTGEPTGILRSCTRYVKSQPSGRQPAESDRVERLVQLFKDYNAVGITGIADRDASPSAIDRYQKLLDKNRLTVRIAVSHHIDTLGAIEEVQKKIKKVAEHPLCKPNPWLRIIGIKTYLDGGMLTGS